MTSEVETLKTNEFLRRRKLRIQQVREQSKDIAKRIRQRASAEKFRYLADLDSEKGKVYLEQQDKLVQKLQQIYTKSLDNFGAGHKKAAEVSKDGDKAEKVDLSKQRARAAAAELRRQKQEKLDEQKKSLDRKLKARELANEISRDKSSTATNKLKASSVKTTEESVQGVNNKTEEVPQQTTSTTEAENKTDEPVTNEMATQWDYEALPNEWEPHIPVLGLSKDDTPKEITPRNVELTSDKNKRLNLFALSDEMPSSLRGGLSSIPQDIPAKPAIALVSDYLQNRNLRLREPDTVSRRSNDDLQSIKQTLMRTRAARAEVSAKGPTNMEKPTKPLHAESSLSKKSSVTMYNHTTRDTRDVPYGDKGVVIRDSQSNDDAYSLAMKESFNENSLDKDTQNKLQDLRSKIAVTKQNVEKEYKDTMAFLKTLPKDKSKPIKSAFRDDQQQQMHKHCRQRKLQQEFKKIQKECKKHSNVSSSARPYRSKSLVTIDSEDDFIAKDFQYSWMPVPESDGNLAIHTIPTTLKENKTGNAVKFSKIDSYHEYRSRHKHTPPTKDTTGHEKRKEVITEQDESDSSATDTSSIAEQLNNRYANKNRKQSGDAKLSDAERIIIYKILDTKEKAKSKQNSKIIRDIANSLSMLSQEKLAKPVGQEVDEIDRPRSSKNIEKHVETRVSFKQLKEGVYKTVTEKGDNIDSVCFDESPLDLNRRNAGTSSLFALRCRKCSVDVACGCDSTEIKTNDEPQPSASTSTTSFKTATNNKTTYLVETEVKATEELAGPTEEAAVSTEGMIKLVDEKSQDSRKLYIGATGFLKDDDYEVIIQLRKKDVGKVDGKQIQNFAKQATPIATPVQSNIEIPTTAQNEASGPPIDMNAKSPPRVDSSSAACGSENEDIPAVNQVSANQIEEQFIANVIFDNNVQPREQTKPKRFSEIGIATNLQDSHVGPSNSTANSGTKPANSISTQTTLDSPVQRPTYFHMSSSTSTAYLSPPECILPFYLKRNRKQSTTDETSEMCKPKDKPAGRKSRETYEEETYERYHAQKSPLYKPKVLSPQYPIKTKSSKKLKAPPNTARSTLSGNEGNNAYSCKKKIHHIDPNNKTLKKCRKCEKHSQLKLYLNSLPRKSRQNISSNNTPGRNARRYSNPYKLRNKTSKSRSLYGRLGRYDLNPVVKWYVDKLLMMNREGLRHMKVMNQHCSSVSTPGSSMIDVSHNIDNNKPMVEPKISLEQIKESLFRKVLDEYNLKLPTAFESDEIGDFEIRKHKVFNFIPRIPKKKPLHKVKSLNVSKNLINPNIRQKSTTKIVLSTSNSTSDISPLKTDDGSESMPRTKTRSRSSPSIRQVSGDRLSLKNTSSDIIPIISSSKLTADHLDAAKTGTSPHESVRVGFEALNAPRRSPSTPRIPLSISTQTSQIIDEEINYIKLAESKLQNMEKIADLTEKCTKRLSNLAKVLDEVRRNKSLAYSQSQVSDTASDTDRASKNSDTQLPSSSAYEPIIEIKGKENVSPLPTDSTDSSYSKENSGKSDSRHNGFVPLLQDIPKPRRVNSPPSPDKSRRANTLPTHLAKKSLTDHNSGKSRGKPPPALSRKCLKLAPEIVEPHELSTVIEVESPLSVKVKSQSARNDSNPRCEPSNASEHREIDQNNNPDLLQSSGNFVKRQTIPTNESTEESKSQMMDLRKFNEIMLKPFISIQEYAKQYNVSNVEELSNANNIREDILNDELSSLHSDGSLPDVIAELLKRNLINEPFRFETASNPNSTTISSESTLSALALSKAKKNKTKDRNENLVETSDTLSFSSNPDLENAFKKLGMGWASSTLKKTKERLALSSSTNTSSSSLSHFKPKSSNNQEFPALVTDSVSTSIPSKVDITKNVEQQTSMLTSMTAKQFLTTELAKKITFSKSRRDDTEEEEFVSLYETKMPEEMKNPTKLIREERSIDSNARARTSTPVQLFKSMTYHSSSSSNVSNGLFSNVDDLSSVKGTSNSLRNHSTSDKDDLTIPSLSLRLRKPQSDYSKSD